MFFFKTATLLIAGAVSFCGAQLPTGWKSCGDKTDLLTVSKFTFTPPPPLIGGTNVTGALLGHLSAPVAQG